MLLLARHEERLTISFAASDAPPALRDAAERIPVVEAPFPLHVGDHGGYGVIFAVTLLLIIVITNVRLRDIWSFALILGVLTLAALITLTGEWDNVLQALGRFQIHLSAGGYFFLALGVFLTWLVVVFVLDRQSYVVFTPLEVRIRPESGGPELVYSIFNMTLAKKREDLFRHWVLGEGSGDLILETSGENGRQFIFPNVLFLPARLETLKAMYRHSPVQFSE